MRRGVATIRSATAVASVVMAVAGFAAPAHAGTLAAPPGKAHEAQSLPVIATSSYAGVEASTRDFRFIHAVISVPEQSAVLGSPPAGRPAGHPSADVPGDFVYPQAYIQLSSGTPAFSHFVPLDASAGDGIGLSIYYAPQGLGVSFTLYPPSGSVFQFQAAMPGAIFDHAAGVADYTNSSGTPVPLPPSTQQFRLMQFQQGAVDAVGGAEGRS